MTCKHKHKLSLYGRGDNNWISTQKFCGNMIYVCEDCGAILEERLTEKKVLNLENNPLRDKTSEVFAEQKESEVKKQ